MKEYQIKYRTVRDDGLVIDDERIAIVEAKSAQDAVKKMPRHYGYYADPLRSELVDIKQI